jgi:starch phosphorylase
MEASGTSGMKAASNGTPNLSVLDGWWAEGYSPAVGWMLGSEDDIVEAKERDRVDAEALYNILELEVAPAFYERDRTGVPRRWVRMMKDCLLSLAEMYNTHRMVREYTERAFLPLHEKGVILAAENAAKAKQLAEWRRHVGQAWQDISIESDVVARNGDVRVGQKMSLSARVRLGRLRPEDVNVQVVYGPLDAQDRIASPATVNMSPTGERDGRITYTAEPVFAASGQYGFAIRVVPKNENLLHPFTPQMVTWE